MEDEGRLSKGDLITELFGHNLRELRGDLAEKLKGSEPIIIERHGQVLGIYLSVQHVNRAKAAEAVEQFHALIDRIVVRETDITPEELAEAFMVERDEDGSDD